jgi:hypothetical protein
VLRSLETLYIAQTLAFQTSLLNQVQLYHFALNIVLKAVLQLLNWLVSMSLIETRSLYTF